MSRAGSASRRPSLLPQILPTLWKKEQPRVWLNCCAIGGEAAFMDPISPLRAPSPALVPPPSLGRVQTHCSHSCWKTLAPPQNLRAFL